MALSGRKTASLAIALLFSNGALALGLGEVSGRAVLGQPLRLEIPISGSDANLARTCFRLHAPRSDVGNDFAARNARIELSGNKLIVATTAAVTEPVIGFAVEAACAGLSREYVMLVGLPAAPAAPVVETPRAAAPAAPASAPVAAPAPAVEKSAAPENALRIAAPVSLEDLSRQKYPLQPKAREKFVRMMMAANTGLTADAPIAAGTELRVPPGLPQRRVGPYLGETKPAPQKKTSSAEPAEAPAATPPAAPPRTAKGGKDRLVLGAARESNEAKLLAEAERLTNMMVEQNKAQDEMTASLTKIEADYAELHKQFVAMQTRLARIEAERAAEKQAAAEAARTQQLVELLAAVLGGGVLGGAGLHFLQRKSARRNADANIIGLDDDPPAADLAAPVAPIRQASVDAPAVPPWIAAKTPANEPARHNAPIVEEKMTPAAMIAAVAGVAASASEADEEVAVATPAAETKSAAEPTEQPAAVSSPEAPLELPPVELPVEPPPVVLEPLDFSPVAPTAEEKSLAPPAAPQADAPKPEQAPAQEALTLDFPEIKLPGVEQDNALDFHK